MKNRSVQTRFMLLATLLVACFSCSRGISYPACFIRAITLPADSIPREFEDLDSLKVDATESALQGAGFSDLDHLEDVEQWWAVRFDNPKGWLHVKSHIESAVMSISSPAFTKLGEESVGIGKDAIRFSLYQSGDEKLGVSLFDMGENKELEKEIGKDMPQYAITVYRRK